MAKGLGGRHPPLARLAAFDAAWAYCRFPVREEPAWQVWNQYSSLLTGLLDGDSPDGAWIRHNPQWDEFTRAATQANTNDPIFAPYRWFCQREGEPHKWFNGVEAQETVGRIARGLEQCELVSTRAWMHHQEELLAAQMNLFACRLYLTPERARAKLAPQADHLAPNAHVCIDFCFQARLEQYLDCYWLRATLSVWTHKPASVTRAPQLPSDQTKERNWARREIHTLRDHYVGALRNGFNQRVRAGFYPTGVRILKHEHLPPQLWFVQDLRFTATPTFVRPLTRFNPLTNAVLKVPDVRSAGLAASVINERMLVLRRFSSNDEEVPYYLIIPFHGRRKKQQDDAQELIENLTDLEAFAVARLFDVVTLVEIYRSHVRVYEAVASQADALWNQLALYLPVTERRRLMVRVHKLIELVHQTLLQSIADLDQAAIRTNEAVQRTERSANALKDRFDRMVSERLLPGKEPIQSSLTEEGYFDRAFRQADRSHKDAEQVQRSYKTLLDGITFAFDERRVREVDVLQQIGLGLAILVAVFAFIPEALNVLFSDWETVTARWTQILKGDIPAQSWLFLPIIITVGVVGFFLSVIGLFRRLRGLAILGSRRFRRHHRRIRNFLSNCATDRLTYLREESWERVRAMLDHQPRDEKSVWDGIFREWDGLDRALARECAEILDELAKDDSLQPSGRSPLTLKDLRKQVERWALEAVLLSERPREFWQFALPRLTFLYRFYPMRNSELQSNSIKAAENDIVADSDFRLTIRTQCSGDPEQIELIRSWALAQIGPPGSSQRQAGHFVGALDRVGLKAGMTRKDFEAMLEQMREHLRRS